MRERVSQEKLQFMQLGMRDIGFQADLGDGFSAAFDDGIRANPTAKLSRGLSNIFDSSESMTADEANERYKLSGTEGAFSPEEKVTEDRARVVAEDLARIKINEAVQAASSRNDPIMGTATQFAAGLAAGLVDPLMMAVNIAGGAAITTGARAVTASATGLARVASFSPKGAQFLQSAYGNATALSLRSVIAREGIESVVTSVAEEAVTFNIGNGQLARDITWKESLTNVLAGSVLGTGLGTVINKQGRQAIGRKFGRSYGESAGPYLEAHFQIADLEQKIGKSKGDFEAQVANYDSFQVKEWHTSEYTFSEAATPTKVYVPIKEDGNIHTISSRSSGVTATDNINQVMNLGQSYVEMDINDLNIAGKQFFDEPQNFNSVTTDIVSNLIGKNADKAKELGAAIQVMLDPDLVNYKEMMDIEEVSKEIVGMLEGKNIDEVLDIFDDISARALVDFDAEKSLSDYLVAQGFDGYSGVGKDFTGANRYNYAHVFDQSSGKLNGVETRSPVANESQLLKEANKKQEIFNNYAEYIKTRAEDTSVPKHNAELTGVEELDPEFKVSENGIGDSLRSNKEILAGAEQLLADIEAQRVQSPDLLTEDLLKAELALKDALGNNAEADIIKNQTQAMSDFLTCRLDIKG